MFRTMKRPTTPRSTLVLESLILESVIVTRMSIHSVGSVVRGAVVRADPATPAAAGTSANAEIAATTASKRSVTLDSSSFSAGRCGRLDRQYGSTARAVQDRAQNLLQDEAAPAVRRAPLTARMAPLEARYVTRSWPFVSVTFSVADLPRFRIGVDFPPIAKLCEILPLFLTRNRVSPRLMLFTGLPLVVLTLIRKSESVTRRVVFGFVTVPPPPPPPTVTPTPSVPFMPASACPVRVQMKGLAP